MSFLIAELAEQISISNGAPLYNGASDYSQMQIWSWYSVLKCLLIALILKQKHPHFCVLLPGLTLLTSLASVLAPPHLASPVPATLDTYLSLLIRGFLNSLELPADSFSWQTTEQLEENNGFDFNTQECRFEWETREEIWGCIPPNQ